MRLEHIPRQDVRTDAVPAKLPSGALTGEAFMGKREQLLKLLSLMRTDDVTELSLLAWLCGDGIVTTKCSAGRYTDCMTFGLKYDRIEGD